MPVPDPTEHPTMRLDDLCELLKLSRSSLYAAAKSGDIPTIRIGRRILVPTAAVRRMLQLDESPPTS
jgi:excisionase family DNA binding protein